MTDERISPLKAIRLKCLDCTGYQTKQVKTCSCVQNCPLWRFRLRLHPFTQKNAKNPLLQAKNFAGKQFMIADELLKSISEENSKEKRLEDG